MKKGFFILSASMGIILCALALRFYLFCILPHPRSEMFVNITIQEGRSLQQISRTLKAQGLISDPFKFVLLAKVRKAERNIKYGEYSFLAPLSPQAILEKLLRGEVLTHAVTIPEGSTTVDIAHIIEKAGLGTADALIGKANSPAFLSSLHIDNHSLEGFLFPDTYRFSKGIGPEVILKKMVTRFRDVFEQEFKPTAAATGLSINETITLASMVEKESSLPAEKPLVAAVFLNRLKKKMRLECDPTVIYGIRQENPQFKGRLRTKHLRKKTSYNTYLMHGLPPGPICNPGRESIRAALNPARVDYLYFVSRNDGTHKFSQTLAEHNRAVYRYQKRR